MRPIAIFAFVLFTCQVQGRPDERKPASSDGIAVQDSVVIKKVLKEVRTYVLRVTRDRRRPLVIREGKKSRRFIVVDFLGIVTRNKNIYTAQIDADEFDHKIPRILYVDVRPYKKTFRVLRIRIGPNHFRKEP